MRRILIGLCFIAIYACNNRLEKKGYYDTGELEVHCELINDSTLDGFYKEFYKSGALKEEVNYLNDKEEGDRIFYHENGMVKSISHYSKGILNGTLKEYSEGGTLLTEGVFRDGLQHGTIKLYYPNGQLKKKVDYVNGKETGEYIAYYPKGGVELYAWRESDKTLSYEEYDEDGNFIDEHRELDFYGEQDTLKPGDMYRGFVKLHGPIPNKLIIQAAITPTWHFNKADWPVLEPNDNGVVMVDTIFEKAGVYAFNTHVYYERKDGVIDSVKIARNIWVIPSSSFER
jgi:antitoxin component YwqK of YwqJK toxin-antitoxin module